MKRIFTTTIALCCALVAFEASAQRHHRHDSPLKARATDTDINQYGQEVSVVPLTAEAQDGFLVFQNRKANYRVWFDVRVQTDGAVFWGTPEGVDKIGNGVSIRRARFALKGQLRRDWYGEFDMDFADGVAELKDAYLRFDGIRNMQLQVGNFKENFSISRNTTSRYLQFIERPMAVAFAPSRHLGFQAKFEVPLFWAAAGVFFQPVDGAETRTNVEDNNKDAGKVETAQNAGTEATGLRIAYVELDSLMSQYQLYKDYEGVLTRKGADIQNTLGQRQRRLESSAAAMQRKYENNGFQTRDELENAQRNLQQQEMELQELAAKLNNEFNEEQARINQEARDSIQNFLKIYNQTKKYDYVMIKAGDNLLIANPQYNITKDIVTGLNKRYNANK